MSETSSSSSSEAIQLTEEDHLEVIECARYGETDDLQELLKLGADVNYRDAGGSTALHKASANGSVEIGQILFNAGATYTKNLSGNTPLHFACLNGQTQMVEWLLKNYADADVYAKNDFGRSAFTEAISAGHEDMARLLLSHASADPALGGSSTSSGAGSGTAGGSSSSSSSSATTSDGAEEEGGIVETETDVDEEDNDLIDEAAAAKEAEEGVGGGGGEGE